MDKHKRIEASLDSATSTTVPFSRQIDKLQAMLKFMIDAENASDTQNYDEIYKKCLAAANFFRAQKDDQWLVRHFLYKCNHIANQTVCVMNFVSTKKSNADDKVQGFTLSQLQETAKRRLTESSYHIIKFDSDTGKYSDALRGANILYHELKKSPPYRVPPEDPGEETDDSWCITAPSMISVVCEQIVNCLLRQADESDNKRNDEYLQLLLTAESLANESENQNLVGACTHRMSQFYEMNGDMNMAYEHAEKYYRLSKKLDNIHRLKACRAMAELYEKMGDLYNARCYLTELEGVASECGDPRIAAEVNMLLADFHATQSKELEEACESARNGFRWALRTENQELTNRLRLWCGIADGRLVEKTFLTTVLCARTDLTAMMSLLKWRDTRIPMRKTNEEDFHRITKCTFLERKDRLKKQRLSALNNTSQVAGPSVISA
ncbi:hypothetical protein AHF37_04089 [Paragonimus kellicotti]|nr:hypothetical protein AHF37_04089 [Paragonimus kellicotti]